MTVDPNLASKYYYSAHKSNINNLAYYYGYIVSLIALNEYDVNSLTGFFLNYFHLLTPHNRVGIPLLFFFVYLKSALKELNLIQGSFPVEPVTYVLLGIVYYKQKDVENALLNLTKARDMKDAPISVIKNLIGVLKSVFFIFKKKRQESY